ncbi:hypothetical protein ACOMHN_058707 [Nucella lapillus]
MSPAKSGKIPNITSAVGTNGRENGTLPPSVLVPFPWLLPIMVMMEGMSGRARMTDDRSWRVGPGAYSARLSGPGICLSRSVVSTSTTRLTDWADPPSPFPAAFYICLPEVRSKAFPPASFPWLCV